METKTNKKFIDNDENLEDYMNCDFFVENVPYLYFYQQIAWCISSYKRILNASYKLISKLLCYVISLKSDLDVLMIGSRIILIHK